MISRIKVWLLAAMASVAVSAHAADFEAGKHYTVLDEPVPVQANGKIHVEEAFWYGCPHCFHLESVLTPWKKQLPDDVEFTGVPAMFGRAWVVHAQLYHVADALGVLDQVHEDIFKALHVGGQRLLDKAEQREFLMAKAGVSAEDFNKTYDSFTVKSRMKQADQRIRAFKIDGVPALIVQGKYIVTARQAGSQEALIKVVDHLIDQERRAL
ncbi:hypothetical protein CHH28_04955 [Bacterioplanes sanyensis]|uniref:Thiol:disulfide interchange protein n=1 Tax=Bacterioplanes sanyensis TaxID=1249553 RepID=A0A222FH31_9GAMM|nr:thiol:disulfide interchange protein DsbA/DsbL [Bacterioplanes sanyensis]ASP38069.1 hypothetical protein CHH28_04955 [Bacterioplanes sanyensis]